MENTNKQKGLLIIVSGPSGTGKGTICDIVRAKLPRMGYSVSATTRAPRAGEVEGKSYFFKTRQEFEAMIANGELLEYAKVYDNYYGSPKKYVMDILASGYDLLLEIDPQGALQVKQNYPQCVMIFVVPPSVEELRARLIGRGTDAPEVIEKRMNELEFYMSFSKHYEYVIVNDVLDKAVEEMLVILEQERNKNKA